jgi:hypothetical protein
MRLFFITGMERSGMAEKLRAICEATMREFGYD